MSGEEAALAAGLLIIGYGIYRKSQEDVLGVPTLHTTGRILRDPTLYGQPLPPQQDVDNQIWEATKTVTAVIQGIVPPETILQLIKDNKISQVKTAKASRWFTWGEVLYTGASSPGGLGIIRGVWPYDKLTVLKNASKLAQIVDRVLDKVGKKPKISSWIRGKNIGNSKSAHMYGAALDFDNTPRSGALYRAIRSEPGIINVGPSRTRSIPTVHVDIAEKNKKKGYQFLYWDDGPVGQDDIIGYRPLGVGKDGI